MDGQRRARGWSPLGLYRSLRIAYQFSGMDAELSRGHGLGALTVPRSSATWRVVCILPRATSDT
jgi:hypothetical protein